MSQLIPHCITQIPNLLDRDAPGLSEWGYYFFEGTDCDGSVFPSTGNFPVFDKVHDGWPFQHADSFYIPPHAQLEVRSQDGLCMAKMTGPVMIKHLGGYLWSWQQADLSPCSPSNPLCGQKVNSNQIGSWIVRRLTPWSEFLSHRDALSSSSATNRVSVATDSHNKTLRFGNLQRSIPIRNNGDKLKTNEKQEEDTYFIYVWLPVLFVVLWLLVVGICFFFLPSRKHDLSHNNVTDASPS
jgi:hypothetical protein